MSETLPNLETPSGRVAHHNQELFTALQVLVDAPQYHPSEVCGGGIGGSRRLRERARLDNGYRILSRGVKGIGGGGGAMRSMEDIKKDIRDDRAFHLVMGGDNKEIILVVDGENSRLHLGGDTCFFAGGDPQFRFQDTLHMGLWEKIEVLTRPLIAKSRSLMALKEETERARYHKAYNALMSL